MSIEQTSESRPGYIYHANFGIDGEQEDFKDVPTEWVWTDLQIRKGGKTETEASWGP